jgi:hypothetical protein
MNEFSCESLAGMLLIALVFLVIYASELAEAGIPGFKIWEVCEW